MITLIFLITSISKYDLGELTFDEWKYARSMLRKDEFFGNQETISKNITSSDFEGGDLTLVIGIPTVKRIRGASYLIGTLESLLRNVSYQNVVFVVLIADTDHKIRKQTAATIVRRYQDAVKSGLLHIIYSPEYIYPDWKKELRITFGDSRRKVKWRSKHNLDESYLMKYSYKLKPKYYLMLEDDIIAYENYLDTIIKHAESSWRDETFVISYCEDGAIGKLFSGKMLPLISDYLRVLWTYKPIDWLISDLLLTLACGYPRKNCEKEINAMKIDYRNLFKHIGRISSSRVEVRIK